MEFSVKMPSSTLNNVESLRQLSFHSTLYRVGRREVLVMKMREKLENFKEFHLFMATIASLERMG